MKKLLFLLSLFLLTVNCSTQKTATNPTKDNQPMQAQKDDDGEYDLVVFDTEYNYYLAAIARPMMTYSEEYLKSRNRFLATEWNNYYSANRYPNIIESSIDYDPNINYGLKYEYKLFQVFNYVRWKYGLRMSGISQADMR